MTTFKAELKSREFVVSLAKNPPKMMAEMLLKAQKYMNAEDALAAIKDVETRGGRRMIIEDKKGSVQIVGLVTGVKGKTKKTPRTVKFTPLVMPIDKILAQIKDEHYFKWPWPLHSSLNVCDKKKYCRFHKDHGHYTEDCKDLKE